MSEDIKKMEEESVDLAGICGGGVGIVLARMDTHPEEFHADSDKWKFIYKDYFRDAMNETEKGMIFDKIKQIRKNEFNQMVLQTLVPPEEKEFTDPDPFPNSYNRPQRVRLTSPDGARNQIVTDKSQSFKDLLAQGWKDSRRMRTQP